MATRNDDQWQLLARYFSGNITKADKLAVDEWIARSAENKQIFEDAEKIWLSSGIRLKQPDFDGAQLLEELKLRIREDNRPRRNLLPAIRPYFSYWKVAAAACLVLISYFVIRSITRENIIINSGDEVATFYLPDSSKVWLNVNSRLTYNRRFRSRLVTLSGEGFFSVKKDTNEFTVKSMSTATKVLGTAFNIRSQTDSLVTLTVAEGKVSMSGIDSGQRETIIVNAGEMAVYKSKTKLAKDKNNDPSFNLWREQNNPAFENEKTNPTEFLSNSFTWRKNQINQSVIDGVLQNNASLAAYSKIVLTATYRREDGTDATVELNIPGTVYPGKKLPYRRRLLDILTDTRSIKVEIESAEITTSKSY
jgi:transmembrane sensor